MGFTRGLNVFGLAFLPDSSRGTMPVYGCPACSSEIFALADVATLAADDVTVVCTRCRVPLVKIRPPQALCPPRTA